MPRFLISSSAVSDGKALLVGDDAHHISRSLRMRVGESLVLCDGEGKDYFCTIDDISDREVLCTVDEVSESQSEPPYRATVYQGLAKGDRFDTVIQKSVECGAYRIVPLMTKRCTVKLSPQDYAKKCARWQKIAEEAAKQSGRGIVPVVEEPISMDELIVRLKQTELPLFCYENGTFPIKEALKNVSTPDHDSAIVIGPEGGFDEDEAAAAVSAGVIPVSLGKRILRTESAAPFVLACLSLAFE